MQPTRYAQLYAVLEVDDERIGEAIVSGADGDLIIRFPFLGQRASVCDLLVDMGDRRAAALQTSEIFKDVRLLS